MKAVLVTLPKSGTRMLTSLIDSHPQLTCRFEQDGDADVRVVHFHNLRWEWLGGRYRRIVLVRDYFDGAVSEMVSPHGQRATGHYDLSPRSIADVLRRRRLYTELLKPHADLILDYDEITEGGKEILSWRCEALCDLLGVERREFTCSMRKTLKMLPKNLEELRGGTFG